MWATHGLAVALALSVLPGGRTLRPGDCEGAEVMGPRSVAVLAEALKPTKPASGRAGAGGGCRAQWGPPGEGPSKHWCDEKKW
jgi:hypothetical protein